MKKTVMTQTEWVSSTLHLCTQCTVGGAETRMIRSIWYVCSLKTQVGINKAVLLNRIALTHETFLENIGRQGEKLSLIFAEAASCTFDPRLLWNAQHIREK